MRLFFSFRPWSLNCAAGDIGAISGVLIYRPEFQADRFRKPHIIAIGYVAFAVLVASYLWFNLGRLNKLRDAQAADKEHLTLDDETDEGDRAFGYRFQV